MTQVAASDVLSFRALSDVQFSADGNYLSYVEADPFRLKGENRERSAVWVHDFAKSMTYCASRGLSGGGHLRFSPDGSKLGFIGHAEQASKPQLYMMDLPSGRQIQVTNSDGEIEQFEWTSSGSSIILLMSEKAGASEDPEQFEADTNYSSLYSLELRSGSLDRISSGYQVWEFAVSPDSNSVIALASDEPYEWSWHVAKLVLIDMQKKSSKTVLDPRPRQIGSLKWSEDGKNVYFISSIISDRGLIGGDLYSFSPFSGNGSLNITNGELGTVHYFDSTDDGRLLALSVNMARAQLSLLSPSTGGKAVTLGSYDFWIDPVFQPMFSLSRSGNAIAVVREDPVSQQEIWIGQISAGSISWSQHTHLNHEQAEKLKGECRLVEWKSFDGTMVQGFLYYNQGEDRRKPLIVNIHGGPSMGYGFRFNQQTRYFLSRGFSVFLPNPRGSTGRGPAFSELNRGNIDGDDFKDILAGINYLADAGLADPSNLFVMGGSYGGYLVAWAVTHSDIFNAAVMNYGISNLMSCHGTEWNIYWDEFLFDINPYREPEKYHRKSPIDYVNNAKTPTLILHGKEDPCVPVGQGREFFRALKELGVETRLLVYPREKHGWTEKEHIIDALQRQAEWFVAHMKS